MYMCSIHAYSASAWPVPLVIISCMTIPRTIITCMAQDELHETCIFHAARKHGPRSHVTGLFKYLSCCHTCKNEVIIECGTVVSQ